jgi:hypothetical protein
MTRLYAFLLRVCSLGILVAHLTPQTAGAAEFCALTVKAVNSDGRPVTSTWIELVDPRGAVVRSQMMVGPELKICDFGFGPHTLRVGTNECLPAAVSNLRVVLGSPLEVTVTLNSCGYRLSGRVGCFLYLRVTDREGSPVEGVDLSPPLSDPAGRTDAYGRYQVAFVGDRDMTLSKDGYYSSTVHLACQANEEVDQGIILTKRDR